MKKKISFVFLACSMSLTLNVHASTYNFDSGFAGFQTFGSTISEGGAVKLTSTGRRNSGSLFLNNSLNASAFNASFDIFIGNGSGADGLTFAWVEAAGLGANGGSLGFSGLTGYAVEFDTYANSGESENHIGINRNNTTSGALTAIDVPELENTGWHHVDVVFNSGDINVSLDNVEYIDFTISGYTEFDAYFGFTAATGGATNEHFVDNFSLEITTVPVPTAVWLFGSALLGLVGMRRKS